MKKSKSKWRWIKTGGFWQFPSKRWSIQLTNYEKMFQVGIWPKKEPWNRILFIESYEKREVKWLAEKWLNLK